MTFRGTDVRVIGAKDAGFATIGVSVDGGEETMVSTASDSRQEGCLLYEAHGLSAGEHTIKVRLLTSGTHAVARLEYLPIQEGLYK